MTKPSGSVGVAGGWKFCRSWWWRRRLCCCGFRRWGWRCTWRDDAIGRGFLFQRVRAIDECEGEGQAGEIGAFRQRHRGFYRKRCAVFIGIESDGGGGEFVILVILDKNIRRLKFILRSDGDGELIIRIRSRKRI